MAEGTIYRHFPDKASLFRAAVLDRNAPVMEFVAALPARAGQATVAENLVEVLERLTLLRADILPLELAIMTDPELSAAPEALPPADAPPDPIALYLNAEQNLGRIQAELDPQRAAIFILITLFGLAVAPVAGGARPTVAEAVDLLLTGMGP